MDYLICRSGKALSALALAILFTTASGCAQAPKKKRVAADGDVADAGGPDVPSDTPPDELPPSGGDSLGFSPDDAGGPEPVDPLGVLGDILGGGAGDAGAADLGDGGMCVGAICVDVFDCYLFHPDKVDCGFTACEGFVCK